MLKLRVSVSLLAIILVVVLAALALMKPELARPLIIAIPAVVVLSMGSVFFVERSRRRRNQHRGAGFGRDRGLRQKVRSVVVVATAIIMIALIIFATTHPDLLLPLSIAIILVAIAGTSAALYIDYKGHRADKPRP